MPSNEESATSETETAGPNANRETGPKLPGWLKVGAVAAASALAGGVAAAWFYRKTLTKLRQEQTPPPASSSMDPEDEI